MAIGESWYCGVRFLYSNLAGTSSQVPHYIGGQQHLAEDFTHKTGLIPNDICANQTYLLSTICSLFL
jgi:hypothetical protein